MALVGQVVWLALPVILGGAVHVAVIKLDWLGPLARLPLDGGATFRGRRLLGAHKTVRGAVTMVGATTLFAFAQAWLFHRYAWARATSLLDFDRVHPLLWGALLGGGYIAGELPNSFVKRRLRVPPGACAPGALGALFWLADQVDSLLGVLACMCLVWVPPAAVAAGLVALTLLAHPAMALVMVGLGLKRRVG
ncbi:MAG: CDP-archaeol synthase [Deltaproteobacteria bacterium]|nr:MAG: CDP-archaeol synthase [Deltaproteobacteria bacterium]